MFYFCKCLSYTTSLLKRSRKQSTDRYLHTKACNKIHSFIAHTISQYIILTLRVQSAVSIVHNDLKKQGWFSVLKFWTRKSDLQCYFHEWNKCKNYVNQLFKNIFFIVVNRIFYNNRGFLYRAEKKTSFLLTKYLISVMFWQTFWWTFSSILELKYAIFLDFTPNKIETLSFSFSRKCSA